MAKVPLNPKHPERVCWGCEKYCPANDLLCGNGTVRTQHPCELFGDDWQEWAAQRNQAFVSTYEILSASERIAKRKNGTT